MVVNAWLTMDICHGRIRGTSGHTGHCGTFVPDKLRDIVRGHPPLFRGCPYVPLSPSWVSP
jgi:hypothetical protein